MQPSRAEWQRIQELCEALEAVKTGDRERHLAQLESNPAIRAQVLELLDAVTDEADLQRSMSIRTAPVAETPTHLGDYRIVARIGVGGSGDVFRAVRTVNGIDHVVALKRFHQHRTSSDHVDRFRREQRMLAALRHPDIVRFVDAGVTDDGRPYLVMELAEGEAITAYCDLARLRIPDRLKLMTDVCDAVQAAHRQLIVHLDLKPSNILVNADHRIKLLDFGTAKLVDPAAGFTRTQSLTLMYASPEQLRGEPVSVACDIYGLGLILYELVSGAWPFGRQDTIVSVAERAAGQIDPAPLARVATEEAAVHRGTTLLRLQQMLGGDLDAICRKALAHDPADRYASVADMAEDLRRLLRGEPVVAHAIPLASRARKFVTRHAIGVLAATAVIAAITGSAVYAVYQARAAGLSASRAEAANDFLTSVLTLTGNDAASRDGMTVRELLALAETRVAPTLGADPTVAADVETALALGFTAQSAFPQAEALASRALAHALEAGDVPRQATVRANLAYLQYVTNRTSEAWTEATAALALWKNNRRQFTVKQAVQVLSQAAATLSYVKTTDPVHREYYQACVDIADPALGATVQAYRARCLVGLATSYTIVDSQYDRAMPLLDEGIRLQRADPTAAGSLATALQMQGMVMRYRGAFAEDERAQREAYEISVRLNGPAVMPTVWQRAVWTVSLIGVNRLDDAYRESEAVMSEARRLVPAKGSYMLWTPLFAATSAACMTGRNQECEALAREALSTLGSAPVKTDARVNAAHGWLGVALARKGQCTEARPLLDEAMTSLQERRRADPFGGVLQRTRDTCK